jgi:hypothetical protein
MRHKVLHPPILTRVGGEGKRSPLGYIAAFLNSFGKYYCAASANALPPLKSQNPRGCHVS